MARNYSARHKLRGQTTAHRVEAGPRTTLVNTTMMRLTAEREQAAPGAPSVAQVGVGPGAGPTYSTPVGEGAAGAPQGGWPPANQGMPLGFQPPGASPGTVMVPPPLGASPATVMVPPPPTASPAIPMPSPAAVGGESSTAGNGQQQAGQIPAAALPPGYSQGSQSPPPGQGIPASLLPPGYNQGTPTGAPQGIPTAAMPPGFSQGGQMAAGPYGAGPAGVSPQQPGAALAMPKPTLPPGYTHGIPMPSPQLGASPAVPMPSPQMGAPGGASPWPQHPAQTQQGWGPWQQGVSPTPQGFSPSQQGSNPTQQGPSPAPQGASPSIQQGAYSSAQSSAPSQGAPTAPQGTAAQTGTGAPAHTTGGQTLWPQAPTGQGSSASPPTVTITETDSATTESPPFTPPPPPPAAQQFRFLMTSQGLPGLAKLGAAPTGEVLLTGRPGEGYAVAGTIYGMPALPDRSLSPTLWLLHDLTVPLDLAPADLSALPPGNQPGLHYTQDGRPPSFGPQANVITIAVPVGTFEPTPEGSYQVNAVLSTAVNQTFHPLAALGPNELPDPNQAMASGTMTAILTDLFLRPATLLPHLRVREQHAERLRAICQSWALRPAQYLDGAAFTRVAVTLEGPVRSTPSRMPTAEALILWGNNRAQLS